MRGVLAPGAKCVLQPEQRKDREERPDEFVEQLLQREPEPAKSLPRGRFGRDGLRDGSHADILAQVAKLYERPVNRLETTATPPLVSNPTES